jgi:hypothetical protein
MAPKKDKPSERDKLPLKTRTIVLTEAGYRCAVPTCRQILALDLHHIWEVSGGGGDEPHNLIALCPTDHALYHRGTIHADSIYLYKAMLVSLSNAFDLEAIDQLLMLARIPGELIASGDGVIRLARLIGAGFVSAQMKANNANLLVTYAINLTPKGKALIEAWRDGDRRRLSIELGASPESLGPP